MKARFLLCFVPLLAGCSEYAVGLALSYKGISASVSATPLKKPALPTGDGEETSAALVTPSK